MQENPKIESMIDCNIDIFSSEVFSKHIDDTRNLLYSGKNLYSYLNEEPEIVNIKNNFEVKDGKYITFIQNVKFEYLFHYEKSDYLYVFFEGRRDLTKPRTGFSRWSYENFLNGSSLFIKDPMFFEYENLRLGWYYGTYDINYLDLTKELILWIATELKIKKDKIILFGSSGGGSSCFTNC